MITPEVADDLIGWLCAHPREVPVALRGELSAGELAALVDATRARNELPAGVVASGVLDTCGTGGATTKPNVSTLVAILLSALGVGVAKHGSRSVRSQVGSVDLAEALGIAVDLPAEALAALYSATGLVIMDAPAYNPVFRAAATGERTGHSTPLFFRYVGPLCNPCRVDHHMLGAASAAGAELMASCARRLRDPRRFAVVHGSDPPVDEVSISSPTLVWTRDGEQVVAPEDFGAARQRHPEGPTSLADAVTLARAVLDGQHDGPVADLVVVNAAMAMTVVGVSATLEGAARDARRALRSGVAGRHLGKVAAHSARLRP